MKLIILSVVVAVAFGAACKIDTLTLQMGNTVIVKMAAKPVAAAAKCATGTFTAAVAGALDTAANLEAAVKTAKPADADKASAKISGWVACKTGYSGTIAFKCDATNTLLDGCTKTAALDTCAADAVKSDSDPKYAAAGAGTNVGSKAWTPCLSDKAVKGAKVALTCASKDKWTVSTAGCGVAAYWGTCPMPTCGNAETTAVVTCNAVSGTGTDCGNAQAKTDAGFKCAKDATASCAAPQCDKKDIWTAATTANAANKVAAYCVATAKVAGGVAVGDCTCTIACTKAAASKNLAGWGCKAVGDTAGAWVCATAGGGGGGGSSASTVSVFAAFAVVLAYLA